MSYELWVLRMKLELKKFFEYLNRDKGTGRQLTEIWKVEFPDGLESIADYPNLTAAMQRADWVRPRSRRSWARTG